MADDARIRAALPTIELLLEKRARAGPVLAPGAAEGARPGDLAAPVRERLGELIDAPVHQAPEVVGPEVRRGVERLDPGSVLLLENTRWERGETKNDPELARELAALADAYVERRLRRRAPRARLDGGGRRSTCGPAVAGLLLEREVATLRGIVEEPERPLVVVLGGAKVTDKIALIDRFLDTADALLIGGAMCFPFFRAQGMPTGDSLVRGGGRRAGAPGARQGGVARTAGCGCRSTSCSASASTRTPSARELDGVDVPDGWMGLDVGPRTADAYAEEIARRRHRLLERPDGRVRARAVRRRDAGGGGGRGERARHDRRRRRRLRRGARAVRPGGPVDHLSTGGGASLELLEGKPLPGVEVLDDA